MVRKQVEQALAHAEQRLGAFSASHKLVVGVSGGPDSLALLHVLVQVRPPKSLIVAHLNHSLRPSAAAEAQIVRDTADAWGVFCRADEEDVAALARDMGCSIEASGRDARYRFLARTAAEFGAGAVAVAHHADDQVETILMHLMRGTGVAGLRGMLPISRVPGAPEIPLIRPFLEVARDDIEAYCREYHLHPIEDLSNRDTSFWRNRLRHQLLPELERQSPKIRQRLRNLASIVAADYEVLEELTQKMWSEVTLDESQHAIILDRNAWRAAPLGLQRSLLRMSLHRLLHSLREVSFATIEQARSLAESGQTGAESTLTGGLSMLVEYDRLIIVMDKANLSFTLPQLPTSQPVTMPVPGFMQLSGRWTIEAAVNNEFTVSEIEGNRDPWLAYVDVQDEALIIRPRQPGERFQPLGMGGKSAKLKEVMINRKIPARLRSFWPLVANGRHLVWFVGHHIDDRVKVRTSSRRIVQLRCRPT